MSVEFSSPSYFNLMSRKMLHDLLELWQSLAKGYLYNRGQIDFEQSLDMKNDFMHA